MHPAVEVLLSVLTKGKTPGDEAGDEASGVVGSIARVYEKARSALEYRADHLARRAAIERILKRHLMFSRDTKELARQLVVELKCAKYLGHGDSEVINREEIEAVIGKYFAAVDGELTYDWVVGVASAEIEEKLNLNVDYRHFTYFAFQVMKQKIESDEERGVDLLIFIAVDKAYAQSDEQQIAYHIVKLIEPDWANKDPDEAVGVLKEAQQLLKKGLSHKLTGRLVTFVRANAAPLVLLRDIYFAAPEKFKELLLDNEMFEKKAKEVLTAQLLQMDKRIGRATFRSVIYIFLTKMIFGLLFEIPVDLWLAGGIAWTPLAINLIFPPGLMWLVSTGSWLPGLPEQKSLIRETWRVVSSFENLGRDKTWVGTQPKRRIGFLYTLFSVLYVVIFVAVFGGIFYLLQLLKFSLASQIIFVFFLSIVAFFAYRIRQTALVYNWSKNEEDKQSLGDMIALPILAVGSRLSQGLSRLNFFVFIFDFILEAPFKTILQFLERWVQFLSSKREEMVVG